MCHSIPSSAAKDLIQSGRLSRRRHRRPDEEDGVPTEGLLTLVSGFLPDAVPVATGSLPDLWDLIFVGFQFAVVGLKTPESCMFIYFSIVVFFSSF